MSPLLSDRVVLKLTPERIALMRFARGWTPSLQTTESASISADTLMDASALDEVLDRLMRSVNPKRLPVDVILSNHLMHFAVLPGDRSLNRTEHYQALARIVFERQYGTLAQDWLFLVSPDDPGRPCLACALDKVLLERLRAAVTKCARMDSLSPVMMQIFNTHRRVFERGTHCLVMGEHGRLTMAFFRRGGWQDVVSRAIDPQDHQAPARCFAEQLALLNHDRPGTAWTCPVEGFLPGSIHPEWQTRLLPKPVTEPIADDGLAGWGPD